MWKKIQSLSLLSFSSCARLNFHTRFLSSLRLVKCVVKNQLLYLRIKTGFCVFITSHADRPSRRSATRINPFDMVLQMSINSSSKRLVETVPAQASIWTPWHCKRLFVLNNVTTVHLGFWEHGAPLYCHYSLLNIWFKSINCFLSNTKFKIPEALGTRCDSNPLTIISNPKTSVCIIDGPKEKKSGLKKKWMESKVKKRTYKKNKKCSEFE